MGSNSGAVPVVYCSKCGASLAPNSPACPACGALQPMAAAPAAASLASTPRYAGFWIRFVAVILDAVIVNILLIPFTGAFGAGMGAAGAAGHPPNPAVLLGSLSTVLGISLIAHWLYEALLLSSSKQATIGKMVCGITVTDELGQRLTFGRATGRHFAKFLSSVLLFIGYVMVAFTARKQALHDIVAGTLVWKR